MNQESEFPVERARRVTPAESQEFRSAIVEQFGWQFTDATDIVIEELYSTKLNY
jgi:hypothetical protein